jgi:hypothetical protein
LASVFPTTVMDATGTKNLSDPHAVIVRRNTVPGPLPVLGFGVAFRWSRHLRRRLDSARRSA